MADSEAMRAGDELVVSLEEMDKTGPAVARGQRSRLLVPGGIPGDRVRVRVVRSLGRSTIAEIVEIVTPSPARVTARCRHAAECGGCGWQHISYPSQLLLKEELLTTLLSRALGGDTPIVEPAVGMPVGDDGMPWRFRHKAAFVFGVGSDGTGLVMGHHARASNEVVPVSECPVHAERANRIAFALRDELVRSGIPAAGAELAGLVRHVIVRSTENEQEAVAMLVVARNDESLSAPLTRLLDSGEKPEGLLLNLHDRPGPYLVGRETLRIAGQGHVREEKLGPSFLVSPTAFFQNNMLAAEVLLGLVVKALPPQKGLRVLDLYSGSGLFSLPLARQKHSVVAVEESRKATRDATVNRRINNVSEEHLRLICARVEDAVVRFKAGRFDVVILDPPREGCSPEVIKEVFGRLRPQIGVLVSCNPEALARELALARDSGYRAERVHPVDMFPHTPHIEAVAVLTRHEARASDSTSITKPRPPRIHHSSPPRSRK